MMPLGQGYEHLYRPGITRKELADAIHQSNPLACGCLGCGCYSLADQLLAHHGRHNLPGSLSFPSEY